LPVFPAHDPTQMPSLQVLPGQGVPSGFAGFVQPLDGSQTPVSWQTSDAVQVTGVPVQVPFWQVLPVVHAFPSLHATPLSGVHVPVGLAHEEHAPVHAVAQHVPLAQVPLWQSVLEKQGAPFACSVATQWPPAHVPGWFQSAVLHGAPSW
jgi:hypothetical protein